MKLFALLAIALVVGSCGAPVAPAPEPRCEPTRAPIIIRVMPNWLQPDPADPKPQRWTD